MEPAADPLLAILASLPARVSPDGRALAANAKGVLEVRRLAPRGERLAHMSHAWATLPSFEWGPDSQTVAFAVRHDRASDARRGADVSRWDVLTGRRHCVTYCEGEADVKVAWMGSLVVAAAPRRVFMGSRWETFEDLGQPTALSATRDKVAVTSGGRVFVFLRGGGPPLALGGTSSVNAARWHPDGGHLVVPVPGGLALRGLGPPGPDRAVGEGAGVASRNWHPSAGLAVARWGPGDLWTVEAYDSQLRRREVSPQRVAGRPTGMVWLDCGILLVRTDEKMYAFWEGRSLASLAEYGDALFRARRR